jgi:ABC-type multidrug transport system ATPase subunit
VDRINLKLQPNQIFVLLGQNGAGKTSLINMLTGITSITDGHATIFSNDVRTQIEKAR